MILNSHYLLLEQDTFESDSFKSFPLMSSQWVFRGAIVTELELWSIFGFFELGVAVKELLYYTSVILIISLSVWQNFILSK